ncbi:MAG: hypothetical protein KF712_00495 [Akkermansiaceae bacterium]|nr:hypothetical protein [Akkermansiaceae bacterium]
MKVASWRLFVALLSLLAGLIIILLLGGLVSSDSEGVKEANQLRQTTFDGALAVTPFIVFIVGSIGGFVGFQRRLKDLDDEDLTLLSESWIYTLLAPLVGGILAVLLYIVFLSGLLGGDIFPSFRQDPLIENQKVTRFSVIFSTHGDFKDYAKLIFWAFIAGFSERFVTNILAQFEAQSGVQGAENRRQREEE